MGWARRRWRDQPPLVSCKRCGSAPTMFVRGSNRHMDENGYSIECSCGAQTVICTEPEEAIRLWTNDIAVLVMGPDLINGGRD